MANRKIIKSKQQSDAGLDLEKSGDHSGAIKLFQKAAQLDPMNVQAWNRQMILYRKLKSKEDEIKLIQNAISEYKKAAEAEHEDWLIENREKAESSRELARVLGLLEPTGRPKGDDPILEKWETRLYLLEYRLKNARKKKPKAAKKASPAIPVKPKQTKNTAKISKPEPKKSKATKPKKTKSAK